MHTKGWTKLLLQRLVPCTFLTLWISCHPSVLSTSRVNSVTFTHRSNLWMFLSYLLLSNFVKTAMEVFCFLILLKWAPFKSVWLSWFWSGRDWIFWISCEGVEPGTMWEFLGCYSIANCITVQRRQEGEEGMACSQGNRAQTDGLDTTLFIVSGLHHVCQGWMVSNLQIKHPLFGTLLLLMLLLFLLIFLSDCCF